MRILAIIIRRSRQCRANRKLLTATHVNDVQGLVDTGFGVEGEPRIHLGRDLARDDLEDLLAELHKQVVKRSVDLLVNVLAVALAILDRGVNELGVFGLLGRGKDQGGVGGGILRLVLVDGRKVTRVADDDLCGVMSAQFHWHPGRPKPRFPRRMMGKAKDVRCRCS